MDSIIKSFVAVAPYINQLTKTDFAVSVCNLEKCLIYVPSKKQDHKLKSGDPHVKNSISYESIITGKKIIRRVGSEVFGFPYIAIAIPIRNDRDEIIGSVTFTEAVDRQDLMLALADNLYDTMQQMMSITDSISENSIKIKELVQELRDSTNEIDKKLDELLNISSHQIDINNYINTLVKDISERAERLRQNAQLLSNEE